MQLRDETRVKSFSSRADVSDSTVMTPPLLACEHASAANDTSTSVRAASRRG